MTEERKCPNCKRDINDNRDYHWNTNLVCAYCCSKANCNTCLARYYTYGG